MENAVKALIMSAGVLIGVMILSLGVALFSSLGRYTESTHKQLEDNAIQKFNQQFTKFINCDNAHGATPEFTLTIQDVVTAANIAYESNLGYGLEDEGPSEFNYYVIVQIDGTRIENNIKDNAPGLLKEKISEKYKCTYENVEINTNTDRVCRINFIEI